jgi:ubiquinone/menaquinone biosynthesis C-methylase UbiE
VGTAEAIGRFPLSTRDERLADLIPPGSLILANQVTGAATPQEAEESFRSYGVDQAWDWIDRGYIKPDSDVLDVGCGLGRVARPLAGYIDTGSYTGIDIVESSIQWCQEHYRRFPRFRFIHADLKNSHYNLEAAAGATQYRFPVETSTFDYLWSTSVFTHMLIDEVDGYLSEMARVSKPGSLLWNTFFLLDKVSEPLARTGTPDGNALRFEIDGGLYLTEDNPCHVIAFHLDRITELHRKHRLEIVHVGFGGWSGRTDAIAGGQDVIVSRSPKG